MNSVINPACYNAKVTAPNGAPTFAFHTPRQFRALPALKLEHTLQDVQAERCNTFTAQPECFSRTLPLQEREYAAAGSKPQVRQPDATPAPTNRRGGQKESARSHNRKQHWKEIYDPNLGKHSIPVVTDPHLMEHIVDDANFILAAEETNRKPWKACGCDYKTVREVCEPLLASPEERNAVRIQLLQGTYHPDMVRAAQIAKKHSKGKMRTLGIATVMDRIVERMIQQAIDNNLPVNPWSPYSYAYLSKRNVKDAIAEVNRIRKDGYKFGITLDLEAFFDNVPHDRLIQKLWTHIKDERVVRLIIAFLTPVIANEETGTRIINRIGTPQGGVISPWLASKLYLDELDKELTQRGHRFVRYADDITVFCRTKQAAKRVMERLISFIEGTMKCPVNREKTKIVDIEHISLLGVELKGGKWQILRKKEREICAEFLILLNMSQKKQDDYYLIKAAQYIRSVIASYDGIQGASRNKIRALKRWSGRRWSDALQHMDMTTPFSAKDFLRWCGIK